MKASEARAIAYSNNQLKLGMDKALKAIKEAAAAGEFRCIISVYYNEGSPYQIAEKLQALGYEAKDSSRQTGPNDSDYFVSICWEA